MCIDTIVIGKKLNCGHVFHESCLIKLIQRSDSDKKCPQCRESIVLSSTINKNTSQIQKYKKESQAILGKSKGIQMLLKMYKSDLKLNLIKNPNTPNSQILFNALNQEELNNTDYQNSKSSSLIDSLKLSCLPKNLDSEILSKNFDIHILRKYLARDINNGLLSFCAMTNFPNAPGQIFWKQSSDKNIKSLPQVYTGDDTSNRRKVHKNRLHFIVD